MSIFMEAHPSIQPLMQYSMSALFGHTQAYSLYCYFHLDMSRDSITLRHKNHPSPARQLVRMFPQPILYIHIRLLSLSSPLFSVICLEIKRMLHSSMTHSDFGSEALSSILRYNEERRSSSLDKLPTVKDQPLRLKSGKGRQILLANRLFVLHPSFPERGSSLAYASMGQSLYAYTMTHALLVANRGRPRTI